MPLPRAQLFEFNDLHSVPAFVRDTVVESLSRTLDWGRMLEGLVAPFERFLAETRATEVLDLGAGNGGPARILAREIARAGRVPPKLLLTDLHPRIETWTKLRAEQPKALDFVAESVDATNIPPPLAEGRARTIINVLHHFPPALASAVLEDAVRGGRGVFVAEGFERNPFQFANFAPLGLTSLLLNPILSPRARLAKAIFTWLTPLAIAVSIWDGLVSTLRVYTESELRAMVAPFGAGWDWQYGRFKYRPFGTGYFFRGVPRR
jgi:SAM-dependent methyltransferase